MSRRRASLGGVAGALTIFLLPAPAAADHPTGALTPYEWACPAGSIPEDGFVDVPTDNAHEEAIDCAVARGLARGTGPGRYSPQMPVTRAQLATFVSLLQDGDPETSTPPSDAFDDDNGSVHEAAINELARQGVVKGTGPRQFSPLALVSRAQMASYLLRAYELATSRDMPQARDHFADDDGTTHERAINAAASLGLTAGTGSGAYDPAGVVRRDQMARFLTRTWGCSRFQPREGQHHDPRCDRYPDVEGLQALQGFEVTVEADRQQFRGQPVDVRVQACNRRSTVLRQTFPQKDWFALEARHQHMAARDDEHFPGLSEMNWYDHDFRKGSLDGSGYGPPQRYPYHGNQLRSRDPDLMYSRIGDRRPKVQAVTWYDGPQTSADQEVVWQPGECKALDPGPWGQGSSDWEETSDIFDAPTLWRHLRSHPLARSTPGWYRLRLHWGGVEVGQSRRYFAVDSPPLHLEGPRISLARDKRTYALDEPVVVTVHACNTNELSYSEDVGRPDTVNDSLFRLEVESRLHGRREVGRVFAQEPIITWTPGQCRAWEVTWDQRFDGKPADEHEAVAFLVNWADTSDGLWQEESTAYEGLR